MELGGYYREMSIVQRTDDVEVEMARYGGGLTNTIRVLMIDKTLHSAVLIKR